MTPEQAIDTINQIVMAVKNLRSFDGEETVMLLKSINVIRDSLKPKEKPE